MKINYKINYSTGIAICPTLTVLIKKVDTFEEQNFKGIMGMGFSKIETENKYQCFIVSISDTLIEQNKSDNDLLPNYASQLGDQFDELSFERERVEDLKILLGDVPKKVAIAKYYGVTKGTISQYSEETLEMKAIYMKLKKLGFSYK
jgi:RNase H-fold protein (predicted Holliday junction resolvase)